jgi:hypothetical protein
MFGKTRPYGAGKPSQKLKVFDMHKNETTVYESISKAALALDVHDRAVSRYLKGTQKKPYKNRYIFTKI